MTEDNTTLSNQPDALVNAPGDELQSTRMMLEHSVSRTTVLQQISHVLVTSSSIHEALNYTTQTLVEGMGFEKSLVLVRQNLIPTVIAQSGYAQEDQAGFGAIQPQIWERFLTEVGKTPNGCLVYDPARKETFPPEVMEVLRVGSFLVAPLKEGEVVVGCLLAGYPITDEDSSPNALWWRQRDVTWFSVLTNQISALVTNAKLIGTLQDRTFELDAEQAWLKASIESLSLGFALLSPHGQVLVKNQALQHMLNLDAGASSIDELETILPNSNLALGVSKVQQDHSQLSLKAVDMGSKVLRILVTPVVANDGEEEKVLGSVILFEDVTEEALLDRSKDEFFSIASHELRTPLSAIRGNASMILQYYDKSLADPELKAMIQDIHEGSVRLIGIVNDFLDVSSIEQGRIAYRREPFALDKVIESIIYEMGAPVKEKGIYLRLTHQAMALATLPQALGDGDRAKQILYNLISNAIKYTEHGGVDVEVTVQEPFLCVRVTDTGRGIPLEAQKLLFRKFQQAGDSILTRDTTRGTGLGLYISKMMAEGMGGSLELERTEPDKGSTFVLRLPLNPGNEVTDQTA